MISRVAIAASFALLAVATPWNLPTTTATKTVTVTAPVPTATTISQCNTGAAQCCQQTEAANSAAGSLLLGLLGIVVEDVTAVIGLDRSPITVIGGSGICDAQSGDLISIGCIPIAL